ncbi:MAG: GAF domain-containing sensor histidine kinase [Anaerolineae bacterium]
MSTARGIAAFITLLQTGDSAALDGYLGELALECLRTGFALSEVTQSLLLCKLAMIGVLQRYSIAIADVWAFNTALDTALHWMIVRFNEQYTAEHNRCMREQHEHLAVMLRLGERSATAVPMAEVLDQVAKGIMAAVETEHCDFYLVAEDQRHTTPKEGFRKRPLTPTSLALFLSNPLNLAIDPFYKELMQRKAPVVSYNAQTDPRVSNPVVNALGAKTVLAVPLVASDRVIAIAVTGTFDNYRAFTEEQIELAWSVARAAALVIDNARLQQQNQQMAALEERERLAREIHDNLAQALSILKLQASNIAELVRIGAVEQALARITEMNRTASEAHVDAREAITNLRTSASSNDDFIPKLRSYLDKYGKTYGIDTHLVLETTPPALTSAAVLQLTRVIQEALANVRKHAHAHAVRVCLGRTDDRFTVVVEDDGIGFDAAAGAQLEGSRFGLQIMQERMVSLGGQLQVDTLIGRGTRIRAEIPLINGKERE